jgi:pimeloyl-ACP methyl ester carboxylesterase
MSNAPQIADALAPANGQTIAYDVFGQADASAVLLIMGNSAPGLVWPDRFCAGLAAAGYRVIRFDQRDSGLSTYVDFERQPYTLADLADDAFGLLDALGIEAAHLVGLSQGGGVAYRMALRAQERVLSLSVIMSSSDMGPKNDAFTGAPPKPGELPRPSPDYVAQVIALNATPADGAEASARRFADNFRLAKGPASPFDEAAWLALGRAFAERPLLRADGLTAAIANNSNNTKAQMATPPLTQADLQALRQPVLLIHGCGDPIFPIAHARWAARVIPGAKLVEIDDMGHALDPAFFKPITEALTGFWRP